MESSERTNESGGIYMTERMCNTKFRILRYLYRNPRESSAAIAEALGIKRRTATNWLKKLREAGFVKRQKVLNNVKTWHSYLTPEGEMAYVNEACKRQELGSNEL